MLFNPTKDQVRLFFIDTWQKAKARSVLTPAETIASHWIEQHPECHALLDDRDQALQAEYSPEQGQTNPFLHLSMHLAVAEQVSIDQPPGIRAAFAQLCERFGNKHDAAHRVFECLAEQIWQQQRNNLPFNSDAYLTCLKKDQRLQG